MAVKVVLVNWLVERMSSYISVEVGEGTPVVVVVKRSILLVYFMLLGLGPVGEVVFHTSTLGPRVGGVSVVSCVSDSSVVVTIRSENEERFNSSLSSIAPRYRGASPFLPTAMVVFSSFNQFKHVTPLPRLCVKSSGR